jgi:hypothetical protein
MRVISQDVIEAMIAEFGRLLRIRRQLFFDIRGSDLLEPFIGRGRGRGQGRLREDRRW